MKNKELQLVRAKAAQTSAEMSEDWRKLVASMLEKEIFKTRSLIIKGINEQIKILRRPIRRVERKRNARKRA
jgi:hypothetical protein